MAVALVLIIALVAFLYFAQPGSTYEFTAFGKQFTITVSQASTS